MKVAIQALGYDKDTLEVEIIQMVQLYQNGEKMKMSKRTGKAVTLRELMEEVGVTQCVTSSQCVAVILI